MTSKPIMATKLDRAIIIFLSFSETSFFEFCIVTTITPPMIRPANAS